MKIAIDCRYIGDSGIGTYIENFVNRLLEEHPEYEYLFICRTDVRLRKRVNIQVLKTDIKPYSIKDLFYFPVREINKCDAFYTPYVSVPLGIRIPIYTTIHDVIFLDRRELTSWTGYFARKLYLWYAMYRSKAIFTVSEFSKSRIIHHFKTKKDIIVTYSAISTGIKDAAKDKTTKIKPPYIIYVGNIKKHKGLRLLLEAYDKVTQKGYSPDLYLVGSAERIRTADTELKSLVQRNEKIKFTGFVPNEQLFRLIAGAQLMVLPTYYEGFGLTPLEGLYLGTDVLISDIEVLKEIYGELPVTFFRCGDECDLADKLMNHSQIMKDIKETRRKIDNLYNTKDIANKILDTIQTHSLY